VEEAPALLTVGAGQLQVEEAHALLTIGDALRAVRTIGPLAARDPYRGPLGGC
jgi:hypothetical protein